MTFAFDPRGKLKGALAFVHHDAASVACTPDLSTHTQMKMPVST